MSPIRSAYVRAEMEKLGQPVPHVPLVRRAKRVALFDRNNPGESLAHMFVIKTRKALGIGPPDWFDVRDAFLAGYEAGKVCQQLRPADKATERP